MDEVIRLCEGQAVASSLSRWQCEAIEGAVRGWQEIKGWSRSPLWFSGIGAKKLHAAHNCAGVVEAGGVTVEIYPKLDAALLQPGAVPDAAQSQSVLSHLMWMLEVGQYENLVETDTAALREELTSFFDLWAYLLASRLLRELENGVARHYIAVEDDALAVRGRIQLAAQITRNWNRFDRIACVWDEFTPDTPLNRLLKCACRFLMPRVTSSRTFFLLDRCLAMLEDVEDVDAFTALSQTEHWRWNRSTERFRIAFDLARRLLRGIGHELGAGEADTFVFLVDMAKVFESYVRAVLEAHYEVEIATQRFVGRLFELPQGGIHQYADYFWRDGERVWIGDAKYKHLTAGHNLPLVFDDLEEDNSEKLSAGKVLNAADVRQLTVYAELVRRAARQKNRVAPRIELMLLYPYIGQNSRRAVAYAWNGDTFSLVPVSPFRRERVADCLPACRNTTARPVAHAPGS